MTTPSPPEASRARHPAGPRWWSATVVAVAIVVVVAASAFAVLAFTGDDGSADPEAAARAMLDAVQGEDLAGVVEHLPPGERRALRDPLVDVGTQLRRLGLLGAGAADPAHLVGPDVRFDGVGVRSEELTDDMVAVDLVSGSATLSMPAGAPPLTDAGHSALEQAFGVTVDAGGTTATRDFGTEPFRLVTIHEGGGWNVSLAYTVADALRADAGVAFPEMGKGPNAIGADLPADAVRDLVTAYADGDPERVLTLMYPDEARALYDYAVLFLPPAKVAAERAGQDGTYDVQLNRLTTVAEGSGGVRTVRVTSLDLDARDQLQKTHVTYDGRCLHTDHRIDDDDAPFAKSDRCSGDARPADQPVEVPDNPVASLAVFGGGADLPTFTVVERNGRWFISPVRTLLGSVVSTLEQTPADGVDALVTRLAASWKAGVGQGISGTPIEPTDLPSTATDADRARARGALLAAGCASLVEGERAPAVTVACLQRLVATGSVAKVDLPAEAGFGVDAPPTTSTTTPTPSTPALPPGIN